DSTAATFLGNATDAEGSTLTATKLSAPAHGSVTFNSDRNTSYGHVRCQDITRALSYSTCDNGTTNGSPDPKCSGTATVSITVTRSEERRVGKDDRASGAEDGTEKVQDRTAASVLDNETEAEGDNVTATKLSPPATGHGD